MTGRVIVLRGDAASIPLPDASVDSIVCDPPYGLEFMGRDWDTFRTGDGFRRSRNEADAGRDNPFGRTSRTSPEYIAGHPFQQWCEAWARECLRVLKPGGHLLAFGGTRVWHRLSCGIEDAGFEIRDSVADLTGIDGPGLMWAYGSGFPKSLDVSKAIDKASVSSSLWDDIRGHLRHWRDTRGMTNSELNLALGSATNGGGRASAWLSEKQRKPELPSKAQWVRLREILGWDHCGLDDIYDCVKDGAERPVLGEHKSIRQGGTWADQERAGMFRQGEVTYPVTAPASDESARWEGWGTALKPAWEPIVVGRKPLAGTVASNIVEYGTGAVNINGCRVGSEARVNHAGGASSLQRVSRVEQGYRPTVTASRNEDSAAIGRWPTNVLLGDEAAVELDRQSGVLASGANPTRRGSDKFRNAYGEFTGSRECVAHRGADSGGASRFFPVFRYEAKADASERPRLPDGTAWPTVKPVALMQWLIRLVTPPGGIVLDPFCGTGTTGQAALIEGFNAILVDKDPQAIALTRVRLAKPVQPLMFAVDGHIGPVVVPPPARPVDSQGDLFGDLEAS